MHILSEILLQYIYNHNQFYILYCYICTCLDTPRAIPVISLY